MSGELNLTRLLASMQPILLEDDFVFCSIPNANYGDYANASPLASYLEPEGLTLLVTQSNAEKFGFAYEGLFKGITLSVHSSLNAVGLTAAVSSKLAELGISANVIAAYYHDHIFVPADKAETALAALAELGHSITSKTS